MMHRRIISLFLISLVTLQREVAGDDGDLATNSETEGQVLTAEEPALTAEGPALTSEAPVESSD